MSLNVSSAKWQQSYLGLNVLTHWGRVTHICVSELTIIGSDNGLSPGRRQAIIWTNDGILLIGPIGTNFNDISIGIQTFSFKKMHFKMSSAKWRPFCLSLNVLKMVCNAFRAQVFGAKCFSSAMYLISHWILPLMYFWPSRYLNILRSKQNGRQFPDDIFKGIFNENVWISIKNSLTFLRV